MQRLISLLLLAPIALPGCLTFSVLDEATAVPLESAEFSLISAASDRVVLGWKTRYEGQLTRSGKLKIDPHLPGCNKVGVFIHDGKKQTHLIEKTNISIETDDSDNMPGACDLIVEVAPVDKGMVLHAYNPDRRLAQAEIDAPVDHPAVTRVLLAATADTAITVVVVAAVPILFAAAILYGMGHSDTATTWTWTP